MSSSYSAYPSVGEARAEFQSRLAEAVQIIELTPKVDKEGQNVGDRAVLVLGGSEKRYALVWTNKKVVRSVSSTSLDHVLEFKND